MLKGRIEDDLRITAIVVKKKGTIYSRQLRINMNQINFFIFFKKKGSSCIYVQVKTDFPHSALSILRAKIFTLFYRNIYTHTYKFPLPHG